MIRPAYTPNIRTERTWSASDVRTACIRNNFYTHGDNDHYTSMLQYVNDNEPTPANLYCVAMDICDHSDDQTISNIMFVLEREAVYTFYTPEE